MASVFGTEKLLKEMLFQRTVAIDSSALLHRVIRGGNGRAFEGGNAIVSCGVRTCLLLCQGRPARNEP